MGTQFACPRCTPAASSSSPACPGGPGASLPAQLGWAGAPAGLPAVSPPEALPAATAWRGRGLGQGGHPYRQQEGDHAVPERPAGQLPGEGAAAEAGQRGAGEPHPGVEPATRSIWSF